MKSFIIFVLLAALIAENVYIYNNPETVCQDLKEKMDSIKKKAKEKGVEYLIDEEIEIKDSAE